MSHLKATLAFAKKLAEQGLIKETMGYNILHTTMPFSKYYKYGLLTDDLVKENDVTREALRRLPREVFFERQYRATRAINVSIGKSVLPESEWLKPEQDVSYMKPMIEQVLAEKQEKADWDSGRIY